MSAECPPRDACMGRFCPRNCDSRLCIAQHQFQSPYECGISYNELLSTLFDIQHPSHSSTGGNRVEPNKLGGHYATVAH